MEKDNVIDLIEDNPMQLLNDLCEKQGKTTLALEQLEEAQRELIRSLGNLKDSAKPESSGGSGSALGKTANFAGALAAIDTFSKGFITNKIWTVAKTAKPFLVGAGAKVAGAASRFGSKAAIATESLAAIPAAVATGIIGLSAAVGLGSMYGIKYSEDQGWIEPIKVEDFDAQINAIDSVMAAANPFIYQGEDELAPGRKGGRAGQQLDDFKKKQATIDQATATLNTIGDIYAASNPHLYQPAATFKEWQQQQTQLADTQAQTEQYWYTKSDNSQKHAVTLNVTNNFKGVTQDHRSLNEIGEYLAQQIMDDINAGRPLYSSN